MPIKCIVFDFANTLCKSNFFHTYPKNFPSWYELIQSKIFGTKEILTLWCQGKLNVFNIAKIIQRHVQWSQDEIIKEMHGGLENLHFNNAVLEFAKQTKKQGFKTALVTNNIDLFTNRVVTFYKLDLVFDTIINSADYKTDQKEELWPIAFRQLGKGINYNTSLLIEDGEKNTTTFRMKGGRVYQYKDDLEFTRWIQNEYQQLNS